MAGLNLGSGDHANVVTQCHGNWLNVDKYSMVHWPQQPDIIADVLTGLPFDDHTFDRCYLGHFLEHLDYETELPVALAEVRRVCQPGAEVRIVGPCVHKAQAMGLDPTWIRTVLDIHGHGPDVPAGIGHRWTPTTEATVQAAREHLDPEAVEVSLGSVCPPAWPNAEWSALWQVAVAATVKERRCSSGRRR